MKKYIFVLISFFVSPAYAGQVSVEPCKGGGSILTSSSSGFLEYWSNDESNWQRQAVNSKGVLIAKRGSIYRLLSCDGVDCVSSKAVWSPEFVCRSEQHSENLKKFGNPINYVDKRTGKETYAIVQTLNNDLIGKILDWNIGLAVAAVHTMGDDAPEMEKPPEVNFHNQTVNEMVRLNVWYYYEYHRTGQYPDLAGTGYEGHF